MYLQIYSFCVIQKKVSNTVLNNMRVNAKIFIFLTIDYSLKYHNNSNNS